MVSLATLARYSILRVTRRGGVQPAITLGPNGWITAYKKCSLLLRLNSPGLARTQAVSGNYAATVTLECSNSSCDGAGLRRSR